MTTPQVTLPSITGIDVALRIAGPGSRSYAFLIDWHVRFVLAVAWFFAARMAYFGSFDVLSGGRPGIEAYTFFVELPAIAIYLLYHPVLEIALRGRTPGKRIAGVRIVNRTGDIPGAGPLLVRNVFRIVDSLPAGYLLGLCTVMFTAQHVRVGDLAAGTLLVFDRSADDEAFPGLGRTLSRTALAPQAADLVQELLDRWPGLDDATRAGIARSLIARLDPAASAQSLAESDSAQLRERLHALLATEAA